MKMSEIPEQGPHYWIIVSSADNWRKTKELGFTIQGLKSRQRNKAALMHPGDKLIAYVTGEKTFGGILTVTSDYWEDHDTPIWKSKDPKKGAEDYPFRLKVEEDLWLPDDERIPVEPLVGPLEHTKRWAEGNWTLAFQGNVHPISGDDYGIIRAAIEDAVAAKV
jgi:hypothetical protein